MSASCILAVDPGLTGALTFYFLAQDVITAEDMPVVGGDVDAATLAAPGQGVTSVFKFGCGFGMVRGVIAASGVPMHLVTPSKWKRHFNLDADKETARARALQYWPDRAEFFARKKDHGRAEAALLARYAAERLVGGGQ